VGDNPVPARLINHRVANIGQAEVTPANEFDIVLIWQAQKNLMFKLFHANRASEYDGSNGADPTQAYTRLIGVYKF